MNNKKLEVVIDAANIIHVDVVNKEGLEEKHLRPERLAKCIQVCQSKGWKTVAILKRGTLLFMEKNPGPMVGDVSVLDEYRNNNSVMVVKQNKEDIFTIETALTRNAWIISDDRWGDEKKEYPNKNWSDIDSRTIRNFSFLDDGEFLIPDLPNNTDEHPRNVSFSEFKELYDKFAFLENKIEHIEETLKSNQTLLENNLTINQSNDIVNYVIEDMLGNGSWVSIDDLYSEISKAVLGTEKSKEQDAGKKLREELGYSKRKGFLQFLINRSKKELRQKKKGGRALVRYN